MHYSVFSIPGVKVSNFKFIVKNIFFKQRLFYMIWFLLLYSTPYWQASSSMTSTKPCYACRHGNNATKIACLWTHTHTTCKATISHCCRHVAITYHAGLASACGTFIGFVGPDIQYRSQKAGRFVSCRRLLPPCTGAYFRISWCFVIQGACSCCRVLSMNWNTETTYFEPLLHYAYLRWRFCY